MKVHEVNEGAGASLIQGKVERAGTALPTGEKAWGVLSICINGGVKKTWPGCPQWCPVTGQEALGTNQNTKTPLDNKCFCYEGGWKLAQVAQRAYGVSNVGDIQNPTRHSPDKPAVADPALSRGPCQPQLLCHDPMKWTQSLACSAHTLLSPLHRRESPPLSVGDSGVLPCWGTCHRVCLLLHLPPGRSPACLPGCPCNAAATTCFLQCYLTRKLSKQANEPAAQTAKMKVSPIAVSAKWNGEEKGASHPSCCAFELQSSPKKAVRSAEVMSQFHSCLQHCCCCLLLALLKYKQFK